MDNDNRNYLLNSFGHMSVDDKSMKYALAWRHMHLSRAKLKASSRTSALLAGFAMVALVELNLDHQKQEHEEPILVIYGVCTTLLVSVHLLALMMSTCILPYMESLSNANSFNAIEDSPHLKMRWYIEVAWFFSVVLGLLLFLLEIGIVFWIKFMHHSRIATYVTTAMLLPVFVLFIVFTYTFYRKLSAHRYETLESRLDEIVRIRLEMEQNGMDMTEHTPPLRDFAPGANSGPVAVDTVMKPYLDL